jgi:hypothetical protein
MKTIFASISLMFFLAANGQEEKSYVCHWHDNNTNVVKMPDSSYGFFKKGNLLYFISNDKDNLYLDIKIEDSGVQSKILQEGLTVWFNTDGKLHKNTGIRYPVGAKYARGQGRQNPAAVGSPSPLAMASTIQLIGFQGQGPNMVPAKDQQDFSGSVQYDSDGNLYNTLRLSLSKLNLLIPEEGKGFEPFSLGIEYGNPPPAINNPRGQNSPVPGGGRGGAPGGGMGGGGQAPPSFETEETSRILWIKKVSLADQP